MTEGPEPPSVLYTVGHGTADRERLAVLLAEAGIALVVDVRTAPGSRRDPDLARDRLARWLPAHGIGYRWEKALGGFRRPPADSPDTVWRNASFRGYAAHTRDPSFREALDGVLRDAARNATVVMCSESVWWRCHRRLIADAAVLTAGADVRHLMHDGRLMPHRPTPGARLREDGLLVYDDLAAADGDR
ncbi:DUF488 family protein [Streptomyces barkulensis]|uniref:DUF488 domain-containing protein n=1 Tax=Streptomyces barkulensis TaxID=1257026 RepID=UPI000C6D91E4|nr:DUF488 domain-containing protein [Streptomyces barkulensis]